MKHKVKIIGAGLAGSEAALFLANHGVCVTLVEMRPTVQTQVHKTGEFSELVCSNSFKSQNPTSAAGMLKYELSVLGSPVYSIANKCKIDAGGSFTVDRNAFSKCVTNAIENNRIIDIERREAVDIYKEAEGFDYLIIATGPLTTKSLSNSLIQITGNDFLSFFDAASPIIDANTIDRSIVFSQNRYVDGIGDYLNCPMNKDEYNIFIKELIEANRVLLKDFETTDLFQACQPIEEIARKSFDAPRFGPMKPVGLTDPITNRRPWAVVQMRPENAACSSYNLVGFQTNLTFPEQKRVFRLIPGLEYAEFFRYGVMHKNTFVCAPRLLDYSQCLSTNDQLLKSKIYIAGQLFGTEGYVEAIRSGLNCAISILCNIKGMKPYKLPAETIFGSLIEYATSKDTVNYQPMHVNFGIIKPLDVPIKNKKQRYEMYSTRASDYINKYASELKKQGII